MAYDLKVYRNDGKKWSMVITHNLLVQQILEEYDRIQFGQNGSEIHDS